MTSRDHISTRGIAYLLVAAVAFSFMTALVKMLGPEIPTAEVVFVRSVISLGLTLAMLRGAGIPLMGNRKGLLIARGLIGFIALLCFFYAIPRLPLADVTVILYTNPFLVAVFAGIFLREGVRKAELLSVVLGLIGVILIARPSFLTGGATKALPTVAVLVTLGGAVAAAIAYVLVRKLRESEHHLVVVLYFPLVSVPACIPLLLVDFVWPTAREWVILLGIGLITQLAQVYMTKGYHLVRAATASTVGYSQILFAGVWGWLIFSEAPDVWLLAGTAVILLGLWIVSRRSAQRGKSDPGGTPSSPTSGAM